MGEEVAWAVRVLFDGDMQVHYGFIYFQDDEDVEIDLIAARGGQVNGLCGAAHPGVLVMSTGLHTGAVPLRVQLHETEPAVEPRWQDVVEVSLASTGGRYGLSTFEARVEVEALPAGTFRARWCASGMDQAHDLTRSAGEPEIDRYLLQLWPADWAPDAVVRLGSDIAAYWHRVAAQTPAPPPPPTPQELAAQDAEQERAREAAWAEQEAAWQVELWGGSAPGEQLGAIGGRTVQLAALNRALVELLAELPAQRQRAVAVWAARRACQLSGVHQSGVRPAR